MTDKVGVTWSDTSAQAPAQTYELNRVKKSYYEDNHLTKDSGWTGGDGYSSVEMASTIFYDEVSSGLEPSVQYFYRARTIDKAGNISSWSSVAGGMTADLQTPNSPSDVSAVACDGTAGKCSPGGTGNKGYEVKLSWTASSDAGTGVTGYKIYRSLTNSANGSGYTLVGYLDVETPGTPITTVYYDNDANNDATFADHTYDPDPNTPGIQNIKSSPSERLNDYAAYHYRIMAIDEAGNETDIVTKDVFQFPTETNYASTTTADVTAPTVPSDLSATPIGIDDLNNDPLTQGIYISFSVSADARSQGRSPSGSGSGINHYVLERAIGDQNGPTEAFVAVSGNLTSLAYQDKGLLEDTYYYYKIQAVDNAGNASDFSPASGIRSKNSQVPTTPMSVNVSAQKGDPAADQDVGHKVTVSFNGSKIKGTGNSVNGYKVYRSAVNYSQSSQWLAMSPVYTFSGLNIPADTPDIQRQFTDTAPADASTYYYKVMAYGYNQSNGNDVESSLSSVAPGTPNIGWDTVPDATPPAVPINVEVKNINPGESHVRNIITWGRVSAPARNGINDFKEYKIYRSSDGIIFDQLLINGNNFLYRSDKSEALDTNYYVDVIPNSASNQAYYYYIVSADDAGAAYKYADGNVINAFDNISDKSAVVSINPGRAYTEIATLSSGKKSQVQNVGVSQATIYWQTDQDADSVVSYRKTGTNDSFITAGTEGFSRTHSVTLRALDKNTTYEYKIKSRNSLKNDTEASGNDLVALSTLDFSISDNSVTTTTSTATVKWNTNIDSDSYVEYKPENSTEKYEVAGDAVPTQNHEVTIKGLKPNSRYVYNLRSVTSDKYIVTKNLDSFKTKDNDLDKFKITPAEASVSEQNITATTAQITWVTTASTTSWVEYGTDAGIYTMSSGDNDFNTLHVVKLANLVPGTKYYYRVKGKDENGIEVFSPESSFTAVLMPEISNLTVRQVESYQVTITLDTNVDTVVSVSYGKDTNYGLRSTKAKAERNHVITLKELDDNSAYHFQISAIDQFKNEVKSDDTTFNTPLDTQGPEVTAIKVDVLPISDSSESASAIISWSTDKPSTTMVEYDDKGSGEKYENHSTEDTTLNTSHTVLIKDLNTSANYRFRVVAKDKRGNLTKTKSATFITPTKEKSLIQIIIKSLEDTFSWTKNVPSFFSRVGNRIIGR